MKSIVYNNKKSLKVTKYNFLRTARGYSSINLDRAIREELYFVPQKVIYKTLRVILSPRKVILNPRKVIISPLLVMFIPQKVIIKFSTLYK